MLSQDRLNELKIADFKGYGAEERDLLVALNEKLTDVTDAQYTMLIAYINSNAKLRELTDQLQYAEGENIITVINAIQKLQAIVTKFQGTLGIDKLKDDKGNKVLELLKRSRKQTSSNIGK